MVRPERVRKLNTAKEGKGGPVVYWMSRDQRAEDNWALLYAAELARGAGVPLIVVFSLRKRFAFATERMLDFMLCGLAEAEQALRQKHVPLYFEFGSPGTALPRFVHARGASALVSDFSPLRHHRAWQAEIVKKVAIPFYEVDAHNIVPAWVASQKQEFGAYTLRPKLHRLLPEYVEEFPRLVVPKTQTDLILPSQVDWRKVRADISADTTVAPALWAKPGEKAAREALKAFLSHKLHGYNERRNDPSEDGQSNLSVYLHFGQLSAQRVVLALLTTERLHIHDVLEKDKNGASGARGSAAAFIEELVVRRELSDNFCLYNAHYDSPAGYPDWAKKTHREHAADVREYVYTKAALARGKTHDELWNAAQLQMVLTGKMHGYMRMYWAKKILEWTPDVREAHRVAVYLNDTYSLDGRDPNGYAGIAWSLGGVHDRAWFERPIFGKIRYMSYGGAKSKFDIGAYISQVNAARGEAGG